MCEIHDENDVSKELKRKLTAMLAWFHNFCLENDLTYYVLGGTALGAVRHEGFIPWDDDVDVGVPRADYERLKTFAAEIRANTNFVLEFPLENKDFPYSFAKLYDTGTVLVENARKPIKRGIYLDVFPLDGVGNTKKEAVQLFNRVTRLMRVRSVYTCVKKKRKFGVNFLISLARCMPSFVISEDKLMKRLDRICKELPYEDCAYVGNLYGAWRAKEIAKKEWFGQPSLQKFEGLTVFAPRDCHSYLQHMYGDYMQLPPVEKRVTHHDYIEMDLNRSYLQSQE